MNFMERHAFGERKLAHYNKWLLDPDRPLGQRYPGFPEELEMQAAAKRRARKSATEVIVEAKAKAKAAVKPKAKRARRGDGPTKQDLACKIYTRLAGDKALVIEAIQAELGMSLAGATTYFYNAKKFA